MNLKNFLLLFLLSINSINLLQDPEQISQCGNGKATYYDAESEENVDLEILLVQLILPQQKILFMIKVMLVEYVTKLLEKKAQKL